MVTPPQELYSRHNLSTLFLSYYNGDQGDTTVPLDTILQIFVPLLTDSLESQTEDSQSSEKSFITHQVKKVTTETDVTMDQFQTILRHIVGFD